MFQAWRLKLREAEEMLRSGQLDEANRVLRDEDLRQYLPGRRLSVQVAQGLANRARRRAIQGEMTAAGRDLRQAVRLAGEIDVITEVRQELISIAADEIESRLSSGEFSAVLRLIDSLEQDHWQDEVLRRFRDVTRRLDSAQNLARRGKFSLAESQMRSAAAVMPNLALLKTREDEYRQLTKQFREWNETLHRAVAAEDWSQALTLSEQMLELAPDYPLGREVRRRAWAHVGASWDKSGPVTATRHLTGSVAEEAAAGCDSESASGAAVAELSADRRFLLWVDGVGGYLVCLGDQLVLGQSTGGGRVDIPICADVSRRHAQISRRGDGYVIEPFQRISINGQPIRETTLLSSGDEIELAGTVRLRFRQPHALSASARLDLVSRHRTDPSVDGILLMAESCVLGPKMQNHVVCRDWQGDVVLYRRDEELHCRAMDAIEIDGLLCDGVGRVGQNSHVVGADFSMSLEELS